MSKEAMKLALEALEDAHHRIEHKQDVTLREKAITALREALAEQPAQQALDKMAENARGLGLDYEPAQCPICKAENSPYPKCGCVTYVEQPQQEPLGFMNAGNILEMQQKSLPYAYVYPVKSTGVSVAVYTSPPAQRTWVELTEPERLACYDLNPARFASAIEVKLKEKNT